MTHASLFRYAPALVAYVTEAHSITPTQSVCKACHVAQIKAYHHSIPLLAAQEVVDGKGVSYFTHNFLHTADMLLYKFVC